MLDLTMADSTANADEILDLTTTGSGYDDGALDFDITGGHEVPEVTEECEDALHLTVPKATFPSAKPPEPQEQVFEITTPTEGSGTENRSLEIGQETVELPNRNTRAAVAEQEDDRIQTVDLFQYFQKGGAAAGSADDGSAAEPDTPESSAQGAVSEAADPNPFVVSVGDENSEVVDAPSDADLGQSDARIQTLAELGKERRDVARAEDSGWDARGRESAELEQDAVDMTSPRERRSQEPSWQNCGGSVQGEVSQEPAPWSAYRDSAEWVQNDAGTASGGITNPAEHGASAPEITEPALFSESEAAQEPPAEVQGARGRSAAWSEHPGLVPVEEEREVENVEQTTMSKTVELPRDYFAVGTANGRDSAAVEKDFVVIADLTAPEEVVVINLADEVGGKTEDLDALETQDNARFANTVQLPRAFPAAAGEPSELDTKLNLAKAYIELGDPKGAREILDEVAHSGNDLQKQDAETLRRQLG